MKKMVVASGNKAKLREIAQIFADVTIVSMQEAGFTGDIEETGSTFEENALIKARAVCDALGIPALADDSGLCVDALGGAPGVYSARYAPTPHECNLKLLAALADVPEEKRTAHFACCIAYCDGDTEFTVTGRCEGRILHAETGTEGFGYDPVFYSDDLKMSFGEAGMDEKNAVSHRGRALAAFAAKLAEMRKNDRK